MPEKDMVSEVEEVEVEPAETETFEDEVEEIGSIAADEQPAADTAEQEPETEESQSSAEAAAATDPLEEFKAKLRRQIGDWYVVHTYSGYENKVKAGIETRIQNLEAEDEVFEVQVPMETVVEYKNTVKKTIRRVRVRGYVLVRMDLTDHSWGVVRHTPGVTGFVGQDAYNPMPLRMDEVFDMLLPVFEEEQQSKGLPTPQPVVESDYSVGDNVRVKSGPFEGMDATISEIKPEAQEVVTLISVFERDTPVTLKFSQIEKM